jgi:hypothetical protein
MVQRDQQGKYLILFFIYSRDVNSLLLPCQAKIKCFFFLFTPWTANQAVQGLVEDPYSFFLEKGQGLSA